jgi:peptidoglycan lytic transglycosylase
VQKRRPRKRAGNTVLRFSSYPMTGLLRTGAFLALAAMAACAVTVKEPPPLQTPPRAAAPAPEPAVSVPKPEVAAPQAAPVRDHVYRETGVAGWYGKELQGKKTASGDVFDSEGLSACHRTLPLGTVIRVTNLDNAKSIDVTINDRGPFAKARILDLSYGAARELGFLANGTARVKVESLEEVRNAARYTVQAATYMEEENARVLKDRLSKKFGLIFIVQTETSIVRFYHVRIGSYTSEKRARQIADKLTLEGLEPFVIRKD